MENAQLIQKQLDLIDRQIRELAGDIARMGHCAVKGCDNVADRALFCKVDSLEVQAPLVACQAHEHTVRKVADAMMLSFDVDTVQTLMEMMEIAREKAPE